ncbi:hypothetical protein [Roseovarius sp.]|uniref:hypothetical protein n=1 Tax=Roseovarius sp. TaxID=1486281 RepID=UPI003B59C799
MFRGTILYFSDDGGVAHIWCAQAGNPLFRARASDFPDLWPDLRVGMVVTVVGSTGTDEAQTVVTLEIAPQDEG